MVHCNYQRQQAVPLKIDLYYLYQYYPIELEQKNLGQDEIVHAKNLVHVTLHVQ